VMTEVQILLASDGASRLTPSLSLSGNDDEADSEDEDEHFSVV